MLATKLYPYRSENEQAFLKGQTDSAFLSIASEVSHTESQSLTNNLKFFNTWFEQTGLVQGLTYATSAKAQNNVHLKFRLSEFYQDYFIQVRGFISMGNHFNVVSDTKNRTFSLRISDGQVHAVQAYFDKIFAWLLTEISFRANLKKLIRLNARFVKAQEAIFNNSNYKVIRQQTQ